ncbi:hypothetical protein ABK040_014731 [Willaertia magna]
MSKGGLWKWSKQIQRRLQRWWALDPEFKNFLPEHQDEFRNPSPASAEPANIPKQAFMKQFHIKYYEHDHRRGLGINPDFIDQIVYRQEIIEAAKAGKLKLKPGEPVGPFYALDMEKKHAYVFDERDNKQVYTYSVDRLSFKPVGVKETPSFYKQQKEEKLLYKPKEESK